MHDAPVAIAAAFYLRRASMIDAGPVNGALQPLRLSLKAAMEPQHVQAVLKLPSTGDRGDQPSCRSQQLQHSSPRRAWRQHRRGLSLTPPAGAIASIICVTPLWSAHHREPDTYASWSFTASVLFRPQVPAAGCAAGDRHRGADGCPRRPL